MVKTPLKLALYSSKKERRNIQNGLKFFSLYKFRAYYRDSQHWLVGDRDPSPMAYAHKPPWM